MLGRSAFGWGLAGGAVGLVLAALILWQSGSFIARHVALQGQGADVVAQLVDTATQTDPAAGCVYVNFPAWLSPKKADYPLGHTGVQIVPEYVGLGRSVYVHRGIEPPLRSLVYPVAAREWDHHYGLHGPAAGLDELERTFREGGGVYLTRFAPGRLILDYVGQVAAETAPTGPTLARFDAWVTLVEAGARPNGDQVIVDLVWQALAPAPADYTVFVHLVGDQPQPLVQADSYPIGGLLPPQRWRPGDRITDRRYLDRPAGAADHADQPWRVLVGLYDRASSQRARALDSRGERYPDDAVPVGGRS